MKRLLAISLLLCFASCGSGRAQSFNLQTGREPVTSLDGLWRFHTGDDPQWADPNFDDSHWPLLRSDESWTTQGYPGYGGFAWYRFTVQVPDGSRAYSLLLGQARTGYQVFLDGNLLDTYGRLGPPGGYYLLDHVLAIPPSASGPRALHIAIRIWHNPRWVAGGGFYGHSYLGGSKLIAQRATAAKRIHMDAYVNDYTYAVVGTLVGLTVLVLFFIRRSEREYLWFALLLLANAADVVWVMVYLTSPVTIDVFRFFDIAFRSAALFSALIFFSIVLHATRSKVWWVAAVLLAIDPLTVGIEHLTLTSMGVGIEAAVYLLCLLPASLWILVVLIQRAIHKDRNALLLLVPTLLWQGFQLIDVLLDVSWRFRMRLGNFQWPALSFSPYRLMPASAIGTLFIFALLIFLVRRFSLARQEEMRLSTEMEAARTMQLFLVPAKPPLTPGFLVESVYLPASEVGGDFFQVQPGEDESLLVVVGDVSGKGLKAAMTVSAIVGGLKQIAARRPAEVLAALNRQLLDETAGGFVTCCAALITSGQKLTLANAGHLSPYRNGSELDVKAGLPLGLVADSVYEEMEYDFAAGDRLTFLSDGVVEARNAAGELYGFARTQNISTQPAAAIAETVKQFGQEDDITVVSITRTAS